jgi:hypothetical protein
MAASETSTAPNESALNVKHRASPDGRGEDPAERRAEHPGHVHGY